MKYIKVETDDNVRYINLNQCGYIVLTKDFFIFSSHGEKVNINLKLINYFDDVRDDLDKFILSNDR